MTNPTAFALAALVTLEDGQTLKVEFTRRMRGLQATLPRLAPGTTPATPDASADCDDLGMGDPDAPTAYASGWADSSGSGGMDAVRAVQDLLNDYNRDGALHWVKLSWVSAQ